MKNSESKKQEMSTEKVLRKIKTNENFHGIAVTSDHSAVCNLIGVDEKTPFPIHSVGKILSGVLMVEMLAQDIIGDKDLTDIGITIPPEIEALILKSNLVLFFANHGFSQLFTYFDPLKSNYRDFNNFILLPR